jgi:hypothetical protein
MHIPFRPPLVLSSAETGNFPTCTCAGFADASFRPQSVPCAADEVAEVRTVITHSLFIAVG